MPDDDLVQLLPQNQHGTEVAGNAETVMVEVTSRIDDWHCHECMTVRFGGAGSLIRLRC